MRIIRSRMSTNRSSRQIIRSKRGLSVGSFLSSENARVAAKLLLEPSLTHYRMYTRLGRTSNIGALHFSCEANGWTNCHNKARNVLLWKNKSFIIWYVRTIIRGSGELCEHIMLRPNGLHTPNPSGSNIFFHNFVYVCQTSNHLRIWSLCLLVVFSASLENLLVNKLVVPRWSSVFRT